MKEYLLDIMAKKELSNALEDSNLTEQSKYVYNCTYKKIISTFRKPIVKFDLQEIVQKFRELNISPNMKSTMISVILLVRRKLALDVEDLLKYRGYKKIYDNGKVEFIMGELNSDIIEYKINKKMETDPILPSTACLKSHYTELFKQENYRDFILNYLLVNLGLRNKDCNLFFTRNKKVILKPKKDETDTKNYLYITKHYCWAVFNEYKTAKTYGRKRIRIRDRHFQIAVDKIYVDQKDMPLLVTNSGQQISDNTLNSYIQSRTCMGIGEGKIFKALVKDIIANPNMAQAHQKLKLLSESRGTDISTIISSYSTQTPV
jgi:hypothetical protein